MGRTRGCWEGQRAGLVKRMLGFLPFPGVCSLPSFLNGLPKARLTQELRMSSSLPSGLHVSSCVNCGGGREKGNSNLQCHEAEEEEQRS